MADEMLVPRQRIEGSILVIRGQRIILDADLAALYEVETRRLNEQVRRNRERFPEDFMFQLTREELADLKSQIATSSGAWGGRRKLPLAFTEHGAIMAASVLNSPRAVQMSIFVVRAFVRAREILHGHADLARRLAELEKKSDKQFRVVFEAIRQLMNPPAARKPRIGYK